MGHSPVCCATTAEPINMPLWLKTLVGPRNQVFDGRADAARVRGSFGGLSRPFKSISNLHCSSLCSVDAKWISQSEGESIKITYWNTLHLDPKLQWTGWLRRHKCVLSPSCNCLPLCRPLWTDHHSTDITSHWKSALMVNFSLVDDLTIQQPGFELLRRYWTKINHFYPHGASSVRVIAIIACPCVCVCVSHAGIVSKRLNVGSPKQHNVIAQGL